MSGRLLRSAPRRPTAPLGFIVRWVSDKEQILGFDGDGDGVTPDDLPEVIAALIGAHGRIAEGDLVNKLRGIGPSELADLSIETATFYVQDAAGHSRASADGPPRSWFARR